MPRCSAGLFAFGKWIFLFVHHKSNLFYLIFLFTKVEKSLQRIHRGQKNAMYTTQKSIENKCGLGDGWKELLMAVGFR